jgi:4-hydroxybenzoate polyprenyltransferase
LAQSRGCVRRPLGEGIITLIHRAETDPVTPVTGPVTANSSAATPLCVDLDGTLVKSDTFYDALCLLLRRKPLAILRLPGWLAGGKARVKAEVARLAPLDAIHLPYNEELLHYLAAEKSNGRAIFLATGADLSLAERVAIHLGFFDGILGSDGKRNLTGSRKLAELHSRFPRFDYIGNAAIDLPLLADSVQPMVANPTRALLRGMQHRKLAPTKVFLDGQAGVKAVFKAIRIHQWAKNVLLFLPLLLSHKISWESTISAVVAFFCFSFVASANYLVNDLLDIESDRQHLTKRLRPFAAGDLSVLTGMGIAFLLVASSCALLPLLPGEFALWLLFYAAVTSTYSLYLKRIPLVDVLVLSGLYALRMLAGAAATRTPISPWLSSFAIFLFLSLAMVKRFSELATLRERGVAASHGRGYLVTDLEQIRSFGTASAYASVVVFSLYISRPDVDALYRHSGRLWLVVPFMLYWLSRVWLLASRGELNDDPVIFALQDKVSLAIGLCIAILAIFATL